MREAGRAAARTLFWVRTLTSIRVKAVFHVNRIVAKRSVFHCFMTTQVELMTCTQ